MQITRLSLACLVFLTCATLSAQVIIDHRYSNTDAQSLIGLPMGSHKTIVDKQGNLKWSQWSLKRKPVDTPIGFSSQMDGELAIQSFSGKEQLSVTGQKLYGGRYPFIVSSAHFRRRCTGGACLRGRPGGQTFREIPNATSGAKGFRCCSALQLPQRYGSDAWPGILLKLSGRERNLPGHVVGPMLENGAGEDVAMVTESAGATINAEDNGLTLALRLSLPAHGEKTLWIELPYEWPVSRNGLSSRAKMATHYSRKPRRNGTTCGAMQQNSSSRRKN